MLFGNNKPSFGQRILQYINGLCIGTPSPRPHLPPKSSPEKSSSRNSSSYKPKRMTFLLDRALLKLSRKNLLVEEFASQQALNLQIEQHLITRINNLTTVAFHGTFNDKLVKSVVYGLRLTSLKVNSFSHQVQTIRSQGTSTIKFRKDSIEAMVFSNSSNSIKLIEQVLTNHHLRSVDHFIFVIDAEVEAIDYHGLFTVYRSHYLFEVQKLMIIDKCVANLVYISRSGDFLKIDNRALSIYLAQQLQTQDPAVNTNDLTQLLFLLLNQGFHVPVSVIVGELTVASKLSRHHDEEFVIRIKYRYPDTEPTINKFLNRLKQSQEAQHNYKKLPQFHENTPEFKVEMGETIELSERCLQLSMKSERDKQMVNVSFGVQFEREEHPNPNDLHL